MIVACERCHGASVRGVQLEVRPEQVGYIAFQCECLTCGHRFFHEEEVNEEERDDRLLQLQQDGLQS